MEVLYIEGKSSTISPIYISSFIFSPVAFPPRVLSFPPLASWFPPCTSGRFFFFSSSGVRFLIRFMSRLDRGAAGHCAPFHYVLLLPSSNYLGRLWASFQQPVAPVCLGRRLRLLEVLV